MTDITALSSFAKALSDPSRLRIVNVLRKASLCVCELTDILQMRQSTLSTNLQVLRASGVVSTCRRGTWVEYFINPACEPLIEAMYLEFSHSGLSDREIERRNARVGMRVEGCCVVSDAILPKGVADAI